MRPFNEEPRDPVTGTSASAARTRSGEGRSPDDIVQEIRATRAQMSATLDELEYRMAPSTISHEIKQSVRETVDDVREQINPRRVAKRAGGAMFETIKENPLPALAAGVSIGYLIKKAVEGDHEPRRIGAYPAYRDRRAPQTWQDQPWDYEDRSWGRSDRNRYYGEPSPAGPDYDEEEEPNLRSRAAERGEQFQEKASELGHQARHRAEEGVRVARERAAGAARSVGRQAREAGDYIERRAVRAERTLEDFVRENPLVAGLITAGIGAIVGAAFPSTQKEDEWMGPTRDQLVDRARDTAEEKVEEVKGAAERVGEDAKRHVQELKEEAKEEVRTIGRSDARRHEPERHSTGTAAGSPPERPPDEQTRPF